MEKKRAPASKIFDREKTVNPKANEPGVSSVEPGGSLLKKNEFTMILIAALVVTVLVFFFFFRRDSAKKIQEKAPEPVNVTQQVSPGFEDRIAALEISLARLSSDPGANENQLPSRAVSSLDGRITRIETAVNLKLDSLIERVDKLEGRINKLATMASASPAKSKPEAKKPVVAAPTAPVAQKKAKTPKKKVEKTKAKKTGLFHAVQKGETLWSISQKHKTTVAMIRKLNNLTPEDKIYPGMNLLVK